MCYDFFEILKCVYKKSLAHTLCVVRGGDGGDQWRFRKGPTVNVDIFACIHFRDFAKKYNFAGI